MSDAWNERLRLIRFRRKRERIRFRDELRIIPKWLVWTCIIGWLISIAIACPINFYNAQHHGDYFPAPDMANQPGLATLALAGTITGGVFVLSCVLCMFGYVYKDAQRRGMNPALWTLLVFILSPAYGFIGLIIYLLVREPLPYSCPQCHATISARFNFCPNCKYNLRPSCAHCQHEVADTDKFCPFCAAELAPTKSQNAPTSADSTT